MDNNAVLSYEQQFYLAGTLLSGVTNIDGGYNIEESPINIIGNGYTYPVRQGPLVGNFNISKYYIGQEPLLNYTGNSPITGSINYHDKSFGFESGYLSEYSISAGLGRIPSCSASIVVYGNIGSGIDAVGSSPHPDIQIPNHGSISLNCSGFSTNRVTDFTYTIRTERKPIYAIGSPFPFQVDLGSTMFQEASFAIDVSDYQVNDIHEYLISPKQHDLFIEFNNPINTHLIERVDLRKARLVSQSIQTDSQDLLTVNLTYRSYINVKDAP